MRNVTFLTPNPWANNVDAITQSIKIIIWVLWIVLSISFILSRWKLKKSLWKVFRNGVLLLNISRTLFPHSFDWTHPLLTMSFFMPLTTPSTLPSLTLLLLSLEHNRVPAKISEDKLQFKSTMKNIYIYIFFLLCPSS